MIKVVGISCIFIKVKKVLYFKGFPLMMLLVLLALAKMESCIMVNTFTHSRASWDAWNTNIGGHVKLQNCTATHFPPSSNISKTITH